MGILQDDGDSPGEDRDGDSPVMEIPQKTMLGIPQDDGDSPGVMEIPQKTMMGIPQEKTVMGIPQTIHHQRRHGTNSDA